MSAVQEMQELVLDDGSVIWSFDGRVLEVFGSWAFSGAYLTSMRIDVRQMTVETSGPDRKGRYELTVVGPGKHVSPTHRFEDATEWDAAQPLIDALRAAGAAFKNG